jgi:hypothetical protein
MSEVLMDREKEYSMMCKYLKLFGFIRRRGKKAEFSIPNDNKNDEVFLYEKISSFVRGDIGVKVIRVFWAPLQNDIEDMLIGLHFTVDNLESKTKITELYDIDDFLNYFKSEIRELKILNLLK